ncbi:unnamed protein product [Bursaphelenchus xylophilus]|uniref:(pine wood nematode) hypothetical protein n=1 Tax=Bursaphelenchus xylophilus TaxID=6326 RepID=A0A1I7SDJ4_BURXY|nr:unnamed protein product [Bursaphelenchus xylophilus]CAG9120786.1 unnamed protein product [Bursaphelenchus xylophilus]
MALEPVNLGHKVWTRIIGYLDDTTLLNFITVHKSLSPLAIEVLYKRRCCRNQIYRLPGETWKEAFADLANRVFWNKWEPMKNVIFCAERNCERFGFVGENDVIVTSFDLLEKFVRHFKLEHSAPELAGKKVWLIRHGELLVVWLPPLHTIKIYEVNTTQLIHSQTFTKPQTPVNGCLLYDERCKLFNAYDQSVHYADVNGDIQKVFYKENGEHLIFYHDGGALRVYNCATEKMREEISTQDSQCQLLKGTNEVMTIHGRYGFRDDRSHKKAEIYDVRSGSDPVCFIDLPRRSSILEACPGLLVKVPGPREVQSTREYMMYSSWPTGKWARVLKPIDQIYDGPPGTWLKLVEESENLVWLTALRPHGETLKTQKLLYFEVFRGRVVCKAMDRTLSTERPHYFHELYRELRNTVRET